MSYTKFLTILIMVALMQPGAVEAENATAPVEAAAAAYQAEDWDRAATAYRAVVDAQPGNGSAWYRLGVSLRHLGKMSEAESALAEAGKAGVPPSFVNYEHAKILAQSRKSKSALAKLQEAVKAGFGNFQALESDREFEALRGEAAFVDVVASAKRNAQPCEYTPEFRQFDFWIGKWQVYDASGTRAGENRISKADAGCLLLEQWTGAGGGTGTSMNFYDPAKGKWVQVWVGGTGTLVDIEGGLMEDGSMRLEGSLYYVTQGTEFPFRGTWTLLPDGRVRQFFEQSNDGGESWTPWFEGFYVREEGQAQR